MLKKIKDFINKKKKNKTSNWVGMIDEDGSMEWFCDNCHVIAHPDGSSLYRTPYCPYCGAKMIENVNIKARTVEEV